MSVLELESVAKRYGSTTALDGLNLQVPRGCVMGVVGPNGAGKTTAFGVVGGLIRPDEGRVDVLGTGAPSPRLLAGRLALMPQDSELNVHAPIRSVLSGLARLQGMSRRDARHAVESVLDDVALRDRGGQRIGELSHGMRRRVAVAQALLGAPELILLDEPTSGLDPSLVVRMRELFASRRGAATMLISSHMLRELETMCDEVAFFESGRCVEQGSVARVTGRFSRLRVRVSAGVDAARIQQVLTEFVISVSDDWVSIDVPAGENVADRNAVILRALLDAGVGILELRLGDDLEAAWLQKRDM